MITPEQVKAVTIPRFWNKIKFGAPDECWEWQSMLARGYGQWGLMENHQLRKVNSHRFLFMKLFGELPKDICVLHRCDNRKCVNPNHMFTGTKKDNSDDMMAKGRGRNNPQSGSNHWKAKLNENDILTIRQRLKNGERQKSIAQSLNVHSTTIGLIARGKNWKHIPA